MNPIPGDHAWSEDALFNKALVYVQKMEEHNADDWEYGFWGSLGLEFLCRAAIAHISPTLLADRKDWRSTHFALGNQPMSKKFVPKSAQTSEVLEILSALLPGFTESYDFCLEQAGRRNAELHSGGLGFEKLETGKWLPKFLIACKTLLASMGKGLDALLADATMAEELISASADAAAKAVAEEIAAYNVVWNDKTSEIKAIAISQSQLWASREKGHRHNCPACNNVGLIRGRPQGAVATQVNDDEIIQRQTVIPTTFECVACGLKITGIAKLVACDLGNAYTETSVSTPADFFGLYTEDDLAEARAELPEFDYQDDNNE